MDDVIPIHCHIHKKELLHTKKKRSLSSSKWIKWKQISQHTHTQQQNTTIKHFHFIYIIAIGSISQQEALLKTYIRIFSSGTVPNIEYTNKSYKLHVLTTVSEAKHIINRKKNGRTSTRMLGTMKSREIHYHYLVIVFRIENYSIDGIIFSSHQKLYRLPIDLRQQIIFLHFIVIFRRRKSRKIMIACLATESKSIACNEILCV